MRTTLLVPLLSFAVLTACGVDMVDTESSAEAALPRSTVTVTGGFGSGRYTVGARVHVFADLDPFTQRLTGWRGSTSHEWHLELDMTRAPLTLSPIVESHPLNISRETFTGSTRRVKDVNLALAPGARGVLLMLHGTGGSAAFADQIEAHALMIEAHARGLTVIVPEAEEAVAGDLDGNGKRRWDPDLLPGNVDLANLDRLLADLEARGRIPACGPRYVIGMSNGGVMAIALGAVAADRALAARFPELVFDGATSYCAPGSALAAATTRTPSAWRMCENDTNESVGEGGAEEAESYASILRARGVPSEVTVHAASPLYDQRFERIGLDAATSAAIAGELRAAGFVDARDFFVVTTDEMLAEVQAEPTAFPRLMSITDRQRKDVANQLNVMTADHDMYSDANARTLDFLGVR